MDLTKADWTMIGVGVGGLLAGVAGASIFSSCTAKPIKTGLSRLYRMKSMRKSEVAFYIMADEGGYYLEYDAPYGLSNEEGEHDEDLDQELLQKVEDSGKFGEPEDAAQAADDIMKELGYSPQDHWLDSLGHDLKEEKA